MHELIRESGDGDVPMTSYQTVRVNQDRPIWERVPRGYGTDDM